MLKSIYAAGLACALAAGVAVTVGCTEHSPQIRIEAQQGKASPVLLGICSVFMRIENSGDGGDNLIKAVADVPGSITEIHDIEEGKMIKREKIYIPPKDTVVLRPMSFHIMVYKMPKDIKEGYEFILHLVFEKSGERDVPIKIGK